MKFNLGILFLLLFASQVLIGQVGSEAHIRDIINEKVRVPAYNEFAHKMYDVHMSIQQGEISQEEGDKKMNFLRDNLESNAPNLEGRGVDEIESGAEPCIAINPQNPDQMILSFMQIDDFPIYHSQDGGSTWTPSITTTTQLWRQANPSSGGMSIGGGDPILVYDTEGVIHLTWVLLDNAFDGYMLYATSTDGGATFSLAQNGQGYIAKGSFFTGIDVLDREWLASDHSEGANKGKTYYASVYFGGTLGEPGIITYSSLPGESNFKNPVIAIPDNGQIVQFSSLKVSDTEPCIWAVIWRMRVQAKDMRYIHDLRMEGKHGLLFSKWARRDRSFPIQNQQKEIHARENSAVSLASSAENVYMVWTDQRMRQQIGYYAYSNDNGLTWSQPIEFGLEVSTDEFHHFFANIAASEDRATISWYEVHKQTLVSNYKMVEIEDDGQTFGIPQTVSATSTNFTGAGTSQFKFYGDYNTSVKNGCFTHSIWSNDTQVLQFMSPNLMDVKMQAQYGNHSC